MFLSARITSTARPGTFGCKEKESAKHAKNAKVPKERRYPNFDRLFWRHLACLADSLRLQREVSVLSRLLIILSRASLLTKASGPDLVDRERGRLPVRATWATKIRTASGSEVHSSLVTFVARLSNFGSTRHLKSTVMLQMGHKGTETPLTTPRVTP
jgi:hypothetical protein